jgi:ornithine cyclodeaminase/alanine dehydrogenase-like protein (mu-crystallin family)
MPGKTLNSKKTLVLSAADVQSIITYRGPDQLMDDLIDRLEHEIKHYNQEEVIIPARDGFNYAVPRIGLVEWMPLYQIGNKVTIKIVGYHPENPGLHGLPTILSSISQYDTATGHLTGIVDGVLLTALRTGAASAIASKYLAKGQSAVVGLIGCGMQAVTQLHALSRVIDVEQVLYCDKDKTTEESFRKRTEVLHLNAGLRPASIDDIVASSDILCTATSIAAHAGPLFDGITPKPHIHINAVGSDFPGKVEIPMDIIDNAFLCPDFVEQALVEGECQRVPRDRIDADLTAVTRDPATFAVHKNSITVFDSTGWALEDQVIMDMFMEYAEMLGVGTEMQLEFAPEDSKDPYHFISHSIHAEKDFDKS